MSWDTLAAITTTNEWQYTPLVTGRIFRLTHVSGSPNPQDLRAVIGQAFAEDVQMFYNTYRIVYKPEIEIYIFIQPGEFISRRIAIKRLDSLSDSWNVQIEVLDGVFDVYENVSLSTQFNKVRSSIMAGVM